TLLSSAALQGFHTPPLFPCRLSDAGSGGENEALRDDDEWEPNAEDLEEGDDPQPERTYKGPRRFMENGRESKVVCQVCGVWYRTISGLTRHAWAHIGDPKSICGVCGETFNSAEDMKVHFEVHQKIHDCSYCGKGFFTASGLKNHVSLHTGERQFKCICGKRFKLEHTLKEHMKVHTTRDRMFLCHICYVGVLFRRYNNYTNNYKIIS
uniref:C2H2-type domain-containing protein n=1 Tax=Xiphophorus couchianus TaxID=32473 RepID=A0A3B5LZM9_9TELE